MNFLNKTIGKYPTGVWLALIALVLTLLGWFMQAYSLINWENAVVLGIQNGSFKGDSLNIALATKEKGEAIADLLWALPITIIAFVGLLKKRFIGFVAAMMTFAICVYFPLFYVFQLWNTNFDTAMGAVLLWGIPSLIGITGLWVNREILKN